MPLTRISGIFFKYLLFSNNGMKAVDYDGLVVKIPMIILSNMIHNTTFIVKEEGENFVATDFTFISNDYVIKEK